jgi:shikimate dehydrogenase
LATIRDSAVKKTGLIGFPIEHSLSPVMLNAVYEYYDLNWTYQLYPCESNAEFHDLMVQIQNPDSGFVGLNVTMPYKTEVAQVVLVNGGVLMGSAQVIQAANVISLTSDNSKSLATARQTLKGYNVDGDGLVASIQNRTDLDLQGASVLIAGTGAVTTAACLALVEAKVATITVVSRRHQRAVDFVDILNINFSHLQDQLAIRGIGYDELVAIQTEMHRASLIIDATPIGMYSDDLAMLPLDLIEPKHTVIDVVYGHGATQLIRAARTAGAKAFDGLGMLVEQAALTFEIWMSQQSEPVELNHDKTVDVMNRAALAELQRREFLGYI